MPCFYSLSLPLLWVSEHRPPNVRFNGNTPRYQIAIKSFSISAEAAAFVNLPAFRR